MNIILGEQNAKQFRDKHILLELDTLYFRELNRELKTFCLVENVPILNMNAVEKMRELHANLIENYRKRDWNYCEQALEHLKGFWGHEVDSFYQDLAERIEQLKEQTLDDSWDSRVQRSLDTVQSN